MKLTAKKLLAAVMTAVLVPLCAAAQTASISGTVSDTGGQPVIGAVVRLSGTNTGAATDEQGRFTLETDVKNPVIEISSGFVIILCTILAAGLGAYFFPVKEIEHE